MKYWRAALVATLATLVAGCADGEPENAPEVTATSTAKPLDMRSTCPMVESALPGLRANASAWQDFLSELDRIASEADLETQNALELMKPGARSMYKLANEGGIPIGAEMSLLASMEKFGARCRAAGSSAFS